MGRGRGEGGGQAGWGSLQASKQCGTPRFPPPSPRSRQAVWQGVGGGSGAHLPPPSVSPPPSTPLPRRRRGRRARGHARGPRVQTCMHPRRWARAGAGDPPASADSGRRRRGGRRTARGPTRPPHAQPPPPPLPWRWPPARLAPDRRRRASRPSRACVGAGRDSATAGGGRGGGWRRAGACSPPRFVANGLAAGLPAAPAVAAPDARAAGRTPPRLALAALVVSAAVARLSLPPPLPASFPFSPSPRRCRPSASRCVPTLFSFWTHLQSPPLPPVPTAPLLSLSTDTRPFHTDLPHSPPANALAPHPPPLPP